MYLLYDNWGFTGIYVFVLIMSGLIAVIFFRNLLKQRNPLLLSFAIALLTMILSKNMFTARNQIFSFLIFELEISCLIELLEHGKKKYFWLLICLAFLLVLFHDTIYILFLVMLLPYLADMIISKIWDLENSFRWKPSHLQNGKYLIILIILMVPIGFCTPIFATTYTNLINCMNGISTSFINELQPINILNETSFLVIVFLTIGLIGFTKTKFKVKDVLFVLGLLLFSMMAKRNLFFLFLIGMIYLTNMITDCCNTYIGEEKIISFENRLESSKFLMTVMSCFILIIAIKNFIYQFAKEYVSDIHYPKEATQWILKNVDQDNMRLWNHFNFGSYLELNGIKVFLDSRSGMYTEQENKGCTVLQDWYYVEEDQIDYQEVFEKYKITHVLVDTSEKLNNHLQKDENYQVIYQDSLYRLYEKIK